MRLFWDPDGCRHWEFKVNVFLDIGSWQHWGWFGGRGSPRREENRMIPQDLLRHLGMGQRVRGDCRRCPGTEAGALNLEGWRERWRFVVHLLGSPVRVSYGAGFKQWVEGERVGGDLCDPLEGGSGEWRLQSWGWDRRVGEEQRERWGSPDSLPASLAWVLLFSFMSRGLDRLIREHSFAMGSG